MGTSFQTEGEMKEIEFVQSMKVLELKENDILVIKADQELSDKQLTSIKELVETKLPPNLKGKIKVFVLDQRMDMGVIREAKEKPGNAPIVDITLGDGGK
jgi:hypothetical protein